MICCINLPLNLLQDCFSGTSIYQNIKNFLLTLILMKISIYSKMIEILEHCIYQKSSNIIKFSLKNAFLCSWGFVNILTQKLGFKKSSLNWVYTPIFHPVDDWENLGFKKSSLSSVYAPRFHPVDKWISTVEFKSS